MAFDAIFRADSENRIKKIIKNGLGGGEPLKNRILGVKMPFFGPPVKGLQMCCPVSVAMLIHAFECLLSDYSIIEPLRSFLGGYLPLSKIDF